MVRLIVVAFIMGLSPSIYAHESVFLKENHDHGMINFRNGFSNRENQSKDYANMDLELLSLPDPYKIKGRAGLGFRKRIYNDNSYFAPFCLLTCVGFPMFGVCGGYGPIFKSDPVSKLAFHGELSAGLGIPVSRYNFITFDVKWETKNFENSSLFPMLGFRHTFK